MKRHKLLLSILSIGLLSCAMLRADEKTEERNTDKRGEISGPVAQGLYSKPVWRKMGRGSYLGGYMDFEYRSRQDGKQKFEALRMVPFIYADIAEGLRFATEIEFEHGGATSSGGGDAKLEFAFLDYDLLGESLGFRGGILLDPLGKFNLIHDSPINDLNDRPQVSRLILPSTFYEPGAGFFGTLYPTDSSKMDYQIYVTQGFNGGSNGNGKISNTSGLRNARSNVNGSGDNNEQVSYVGRIGFSPILGSEIGVSLHTGPWDDAGKNNLSVYALDWGFQWKGLEFLGEYGNAEIERSTPTHTSVPGRMDGYYLQLNYHFLEDAIRKGSVFTGVARWDHTDLDLLNQTSAQTANSAQRLTLGLNFRPIEQTVFKIDYQINYEDLAPARTHNNAWVLGFATYF
ncbi:MAG: hypothetical protein HYS58_00945 [Elusimicrobia bacterium]|nr:hypothetical protein [Elusimicrobiota bacterium]